MLESPGEILTLVAGGLIGIACARIERTWLRRASWAVLSLAGGALVSAINGEYPLHPEFLAFDVPVVAGVALAVGLTLRGFRRDSADRSS